MRAGGIAPPILLEAVDEKACIVRAITSRKEDWDRNVERGNFGT